MGEWGSHEWEAVVFLGGIICIAVILYLITKTREGNLFSCGSIVHKHCWGETREQLLRACTIVNGKETGISERMYRWKECKHERCRKMMTVYGNGFSFISNMPKEWIK